MTVSEVASYIFDMPLHNVCSKDSTLITKGVSYLGIGVLTTFSCGYYGMRASRFFAADKYDRDKRELDRFLSVPDINDMRNHILALKSRGGEPMVANMINGRDSEGHKTYSPHLLHEAVKSGEFEMAMLLIENGADLNATGRAGTPLETVLKVAANKLKKVEFLVETAKVDVNGGDRCIFGDGPILLVALDAYRRLDTPEQKQEMINVIQYLISQNANVNYAKNLHSLVASMAIIWKDFPDEARAVLNLMLARGAKLKEGENLDDLCPDARDFLSNLPH